MAALGYGLQYGAIDSMATNYSDKVLQTPGLEFYFNNREGGAAQKFIDRSGKNRHGYVIGGVFTESGTVPTADTASIGIVTPADGSVGVEIPGTEQLNFDSWSFSFFYKRVDGAEPTDNWPIIGKPLSNTLGLDKFALSFLPAEPEAADHASLYFTSGDDAVWANSRYTEYKVADITLANAWLHFVVTYNDGEFAVWRNGVKIAGVAGSNELPDDEPNAVEREREEQVKANNNNKMIHLFAEANPTTDAFPVATHSCQGSFAEMAFFSRVLFGPEIAALYAARV